MCELCNPNLNRSEDPLGDFLVSQCVIDNSKEVIRELAEKAAAVLDFYYDATIEDGKKEVRIKEELEIALEMAKRYVNS